MNGCIREVCAVILLLAEQSLPAGVRFEGVEEEPESTATEGGAAAQGEGEEKKATRAFFSGEGGSSYLRK